MAGRSHAESGIEGGQGGLRLGKFGLPIEQALAVLFQDRGGHFLREVGVVQLGLDFDDLGFDFLQFPG